MDVKATPMYSKRVIRHVSTHDNVHTRLDYFLKHQKKKWDLCLRIYIEKEGGKCIHAVVAIKID